MPTIVKIFTQEDSLMAMNEKIKIPDAMPKFKHRDKPPSVISLGPPVETRTNIFS